MTTLYPYLGFLHHAEMRTSLSILAALFFVLTCMPLTHGQDKMSAHGKGTVCYLNPRSLNTVIPAPDRFRQMKAGARTKSANIEVVYVGFSDPAREAFQAAVDIWSSLIVTEVPIHIRAVWTELGQNVLGGAGPGSYHRNFEGAQRTNIWYPVALAEKLARKELNGTDPDIVASFNSTDVNWHFGLEGSAPPANRYDFMSVVLHEIGHGLGITNSYATNSTEGFISSGFSGSPLVFEVNLENSAGDALVTNFESPSSALGSVLRGGDLFFDSPLVRAVNTDEPARIFAPFPYDEGSSIAHLDEQEYRAGNPNSLMTPQIGAAERVLDPGPIIMGILKEMGWITTFILHEPLKGTENTTDPYEVKCKVTSDTSFDPGTLTLNHSANGTDFSAVTMTATGTPEEYVAVIPVGSTNYHYFIEVTDSDLRKITMPGLAYQQGQPVTQSVFTFEAGADVEAPTINHIPKPYIVDFEPLKIEAVITDNIGVLHAKMEWDINGDVQPVQALTLKAGTNSTYIKEIIFAAGSISPGDLIHYRIVATDVSVAENKGNAPSASTFFEIAVNGLSAPQDSYFNDFNTLSDADFYGTGFSMLTPEGFDNGAIHSVHPYPEGIGAPGDERNLFYHLRIPIRVKTTGATIRFDEIVLVEPGEPGASFGTSDFFDFVSVEGSIDGGKTWLHVADGYDSRSDDEWLDHYESEMTGQVSTAEGHSGLYRNRIINLLDKYLPGTVVALRFRVYSDPLAAGWGWAIDNLGIQVDNIQPEVRHQHVDYLLEGATEFTVDATIIDATGLERVAVEYKINQGPVTSTNLALDANNDNYSHTLNFPALMGTDILYYRIIATDVVGNGTSIPTVDFLTVPAISLSAPVDQFIAGFASPTGDVMGNYFSIGKQDGFLNGAIHSPHPYPVGLQPDGTSFTWILRKPIRVSDTNPYISFDEVVITEGAGSLAVDYVVIEASKDGINWETLLPEHAASFAPAWSTVFAAGTAGTSMMFVRRLCRITESGAFQAGDIILVRCRFFSGLATTGWGFAIDNLSIQGPVTATDVYAQESSVYPNPASGSTLFVRLSPGRNELVSVQLMSSQGQTLRSEELVATVDVIDHPVDITNLSKGLYFVRAATPKGTVVLKFIKD
jgi:hypothetical protein